MIALTGCILRESGMDNTRPHLAVRGIVGHRIVREVTRRLSHPTREQVAYALIAVLALGTRLWDLGSRALHHDESLHTYFSWVYEQGHGYVHHPMMHGPALFHLVAFSYLLFGSSDWSSRLPAALFGIALVLLPALLRGDRFLGRWGALSASLFLLLSPSVLYFSRFIRHDIFAVVSTALLFICILRYAERPARGWLVGALVSAAFMLTTHEVTFVSLFILVTVLAIAAAARIAPLLLATSGLALAVFGAILVLFHRLGVPDLPAIPWENPTSEAVVSFAVRLATHPITLTATGIALLWAIWSWYVLQRHKAPEEPWSAWLERVAPEGSLARAIGRALGDRVGLAWGFSVGTGLFVVLYTSLFTNLGGLASGTFGALGYWLGQHGVQRGEQPWFYYLVMLPQYEPVATGALLVGAIVTVHGGGSAVLGRRELNARWRTQAFLLYWSAVMMAVLSWAGEKMPWLVIHITVPLCFLAGSLVGPLLERAETWWHTCAPPQRRIAWALGLVTLIFLAQAFLALAWVTAGPFDATAAGAPRTLRTDGVPFLRLAWIPLLAILVLLAATALDRRWRPYAGAVT
ncbi:MAG: TIGR03663 family protein, partial [Thermomicrobium sp.]|nr:TIGR03663 family protein [Thermomicrobium sp.]